jgi:hypothetical protein
VVKALVLRGVGAGALAGLVAFIFARVFAEPVIQAAIDYEGARDDARNALAAAAGQAVEPAEADIFSRTIQANVGIGVGMILFGCAVGAVFAVVYSLAWGRTGRQGPRQLALLVALAGFVTLYLVPFLKYPANPPSIGHPDTIADRSGLYLVMVLGSVVAALVAVWAGQRLAQRLGNWNATLVGIACFVVLVGLLMAALPSLGQLQTNVEQYGNLATETPQPILDPHGGIVLAGFDADLLYRFRLYAVGAQVLLWAVLGLCFAPLAERVLGRSTTATVDITEPSPA